ncbi:hypothetical protein K438DRAFT_1993722 [Mycena galopus ATCC 62051]|nr:hypothetical protein K438DRAFT_1993722 [Mycena galopus ATCC 62051]
MSYETILNGPDHRDPLQMRHVTNGCHVTHTLAARLPSVPHSLLTCTQKAAGADQPVAASSPDSLLTSLASSSSTTTPPGTPPHTATPAYESDTTSSSPELPSRHVMLTNGTASLDLPPTKLPLLHEGETNQSQLRQLEVHCQNYFSLKSIPSDKQVANVTGCFRDYRITTWLDDDAERAAAIAMDFKAFMAAVRERLLPTDWERTIKQEMHGRKQGKNETFLVFLTTVGRLNSLLINTPSFLDESHLRTLLESNMLTDLSDGLAEDGKAADENDYKKWPWVSGSLYFSLDAPSSLLPLGEFGCTQTPSPWIVALHDVFRFYGVICPLVMLCRCAAAVGVTQCCRSPESAPARTLRFNGKQVGRGSDLRLMYVQRRCHTTICGTTEFVVAMWTAVRRVRSVPHISKPRNMHKWAWVATADKSPVRFPLHAVSPPRRAHSLVCSVC